MRVIAGVDGGGTRTTVALATVSGGALTRVSGPAGIVDPRHPEKSAHLVAELVRMAAAQTGGSLPVASICAGLAGVGSEPERLAVQRQLELAGVAERVEVVGDGQIALEGALAGGPGILLIAGTGSIAWGRGPDGRAARTGGWGMVLGDEGSGFAIARAGLSAALRAVDGRGRPTTLEASLMAAAGVGDPSGLPPWAGRASKAEIAALARKVLEAAEAGDPVAGEIVATQAMEAALHVRALATRLGPWPGRVPTVFHGGVLGRPSYAEQVEAALTTYTPGFEVRAPAADAVSGALSRARALCAIAEPRGSEAAGALQR